MWCFQTVSPSLFIVAVLVYSAGVVNFALLVSSFFHSPGAATKGAVFLWLASIGALFFNSAVFNLAASNCLGGMEYVVSDRQSRV